MRLLMAVFPRDTPRWSAYLRRPALFRARHATHPPRMTQPITIKNRTHSENAEQKSKDVDWGGIRSEDQCEAMVFRSHFEYIYPYTAERFRYFSGLTHNTWSVSGGDSGR